MKWTVADVMSSPVDTVGATASVQSSLDLMHWKQIGALPVVTSRGALVGLLTEVDVLRHAGGVAGEIMNTDVATVPPEASIAAAARVMIQRQVTHLLVLNALGRLSGIVSRLDLLRVFLRSDESIRKEIANGLLRELPLLGRGRVKVEVADGVVRLRGESDSAALTGLLLRLVAAVPGVTGVENDLESSQPVEGVSRA